MFFKKSKRIKELEKENEELRRTNKLLRNSNKYPMKNETLKIEKICATFEFPACYDYMFDHMLIKDEIEKKFVSALRPFIKIENDYDKENNKYFVRVSIRVAKEETT